MPSGIQIQFDIALRRATRGWSQEHLADVCGISARTLRRAEAGLCLSPRTMRAIQAALAPWPAGEALAPTSILVGTRDLRIGGVVCSESVRVATAPKGWRVLLVCSSEPIDAEPTWCLSADGFCREIGSPKETVFATQADAIVAAAWRLEYYRRVNHPVLCQRRRDALARNERRMPHEDVWNDAAMASLDRTHRCQLAAAS